MGSIRLAGRCRGVCRRRAESDRPAAVRPGRPWVTIVNDFAFSAPPRAVASLSAEALASVLDQSVDCVKLVGLDGEVQYMNANGLCAMEVDDFAAIAGKPWPSLWPEESRPLLDEAMAGAREGRISRFEAFCPTAKGEPRWWEVTVSPVWSPAGSVDAMLSTSRDVTDRHRREQSAATVAHEMRHRLRNAHSVGAALLLASGRSEPEHLEFARTVAERLARLSDLHAKLVDVGGGIDLADVCADVAQVFEQSGGRLALGALPDIHLDEGRARTISLLLGELTTNSLKHGALGRGGKAALHGSIAGGQLLLDWTETFEAADAAAPALSSGQGSELMQRIIRLYRGDIASGAIDGGYRAAIRLPLE